MREERCRERGRKRVGGRNERGKHSQSYRNAGNNVETKQAANQNCSRHVPDAVTVNSRKGYTASLLLQIS